jgi:hypothetical protein
MTASGIEGVNPTDITNWREYSGVEGIVNIRDTIPGVNRRGQELLVAEWDINMARFGTADRLAAWSD